MKQGLVSPDQRVFLYPRCGRNFYGTGEQRLPLCDNVLRSNLCRFSVLCTRRFYHWSV